MSCKITKAILGTLARKIVTNDVRSKITQSGHTGWHQEIYNGLFLCVPNEGARVITNGKMLHIFFT